MQDFYSAENGHLRPSDLGESRTSFRPTEEVVFGAAPERPPDLNSFTTKFRVTNSAKQGSEVVQQRGVRAGDVDSDEEQGEGSEEESEVEEEVHMTKNMRNKKRKALALSRTIMDGDDGLDSVHLPAEMPIQFKKQNTSSTGKKDKYGILVDTAVKSSKNVANKGNKEGTKDHGEMEKLRAKVQEAYKLLKEKRRLEG